MINAILSLLSDVTRHAPAAPPAEGFQGLLNLLLPVAPDSPGEPDGAAGATAAPTSSGPVVAAESGGTTGGAGTPAQASTGATVEAAGTEGRQEGMPRLAGIGAQLRQRLAGKKTAAGTARGAQPSESAELDAVDPVPSEDDADPTPSLAVVPAAELAGGALIPAAPRPPAADTAAGNATGESAGTASRGRFRTGSGVPAVRIGTEAPIPAGRARTKGPQPSAAGRAGGSDAPGGGPANPTAMSQETAARRVDSANVRESQSLVRTPSGNLRDGSAVASSTPRLDPDTQATGGEAPRWSGAPLAETGVRQTGDEEGHGPGGENNAEPDSGRLPDRPQLGTGGPGTPARSAGPGIATLSMPASARETAERVAPGEDGRGAGSWGGTRAASGRPPGDREADDEGETRPFEQVPAQGSGSRVSGTGRPVVRTPTLATRADPAERIETIESIRQRESLQPVHRVSLRVGEGDSAARVRVDLRGDGMRTDMTTDSARLAGRLGRDLPELSQALRSRGLEAESTHVRHGDRLVASQVAPTRPTGDSRAEAGNQNSSQRSGRQPHTQDGRERSRDQQEQEGDE